jgi:FkbM family methyltransferase
LNSLRLLIRRLCNRLIGGKLVSIYRILGLHVSDNICGNQITYDPNTDIGNTLFFSGEFERKELEICKQYISETSIVLDIGANIGIHSIYFSKLAKKGYVLALEPSIETFGFLLRNIANEHNIVPINIAADDEGRIASFFQASDNAYSSLKDTRRKKIIRVVKVPCIKIDDVVSGLKLGRVDFVKIDVEGTEHNVLRGMKEVISKYKPIIFCEIYEGQSSNRHPDETVSFLVEKGYRAYVIRDDRIVEYKKHNDVFYNYLFLPNGEQQS